MDKKCIFLGDDKPNSIKCKVLSVDKCNSEKCSFFKTEQEYEEGIKKANARLATLDNVLQEHIADKYYNGKKIWQESNS